MWLDDNIGRKFDPKNATCQYPVSKIIKMMSIYTNFALCNFCSFEFVVSFTCYAGLSDTLGHSL